VADTIRAIAEREQKKREIAQVVRDTNNPQKKASTFWTITILGGILFVFYGLPLIQGKGVPKPGMSKPIE
jgi:hypothetical protein